MITLFLMGGGLIAQDGFMSISQPDQIGFTNTYEVNVFYINDSDDFTPNSLSVQISVNGAVNDLDLTVVGSPGWTANDQARTFSGGVNQGLWNPALPNLIGKVRFVPSSTGCVTITAGSVLLFGATGLRQPAAATTLPECFISGEVRLAVPGDELMTRVVRLYDGPTFNLPAIVSSPTSAASYLIEQGNIANPNLDCVNSTTRPKFDLQRITVADVNAISNNIMGSVPFTEAYQMVAADVDQSETVDVGDMVDIQRGILGIDESGMVKAWNHVTETSLNTTVQFGDGPVIYTEEYTASDIQTGGDLNFVAIKSGDVVVDALEYDKSGSSDLVEMMDRSLQTGETVEVPVYLSHKDKYNVVALKLNYAAEDIEVLDIVSGELLLRSTDNYKIDAETGAVALITNVFENDVELTGERPAFYLRLRAKKTLESIRDLFAVEPGENSQILGYDKANNKSARNGLALQWRGSTANFNVEVISANPFREQLRLVVEALKPQSISVQIIDLSGRKLLNGAYEVTTGSSTVNLDQFTPSLKPGVYVLMVSSDSGERFTTKVIKQ